MGYPVLLYRSPMHDHHWIVFSPRVGWMIFPAEVGGWQHRQAYPDAETATLQPVPLWMGFNTGLLEAVIARAA